jgi:ribose-phosphate pyrophosphokinase
MERLAHLQDRVKEIIFTNTVPHKKEDLLPNMTMLSIAPLLGEVIWRAHVGQSVGELFNE